MKEEQDEFSGVLDAFASTIKRSGHQDPDKVTRLCRLLVAKHQPAELKNAIAEEIERAIQI